MHSQIILCLFNFNLIVVHACVYTYFYLLLSSPIIHTRVPNNNLSLSLSYIISIHVCYSKKNYFSVINVKVLKKIRWIYDGIIFLESELILNNIS